jgi:uncharacterized membrane protein
MRAIAGPSRPEAAMQRSLVLYLVTLVVLVGLDALYLGVFAKEFFAAQVGDMLGDVRPVPAVLFYLLYVAGVLIFVSGPATATVASTLLFGALYGLFCYATFELTSLAMLRHWTWPVVTVDMSWGVIVTAISASAGLWVANWLAPRG